MTALIPATAASTTGWAMVLKISRVVHGGWKTWSNEKIPEGTGLPSTAWAIDLVSMSQEALLVAATAASRALSGRTRTATRTESLHEEAEVEARTLRGGRVPVGGMVEVEGIGWSRWEDLLEWTGDEDMIVFFEGVGLPRKEEKEIKDRDEDVGKRDEGK